MQDDDTINARIAAQVRGRRAAGGLSLQQLADRSDVSRSMLSLIERGETSATAVVLEKIATGLGVPLAALFAADTDERAPVARRDDQPVWRDPGSGYLRRAVSPGGFRSPFQIVEISFPAGAAVAYETGARSPHVHQQVWVLEGEIVVTAGDESHRLGSGDCLAMRLDRPTAFRNDTPVAARYAVIVSSGLRGRP